MIPNLPTSKAVLTPMAAAAFATLYFLLDLFSILLCVRAAWLGLRTVSPCECGLSIGTWLCLRDRAAASYCQMSMLAG